MLARRPAGLRLEMTTTRRRSSTSRVGISNVKLDAEALENKNFQTFLLSRVWSFSSNHGRIHGVPIVEIMPRDHRIALIPRDESPERITWWEIRARNASPLRRGTSTCQGTVCFRRLRLRKPISPGAFVLGTIALADPLHPLDQPGRIAVADGNPKPRVVLPRRRGNRMYPHGGTVSRGATGGIRVAGPPHPDAPRGPTPLQILYRRASSPILVEGMASTPTRHLDEASSIHRNYGFAEGDAPGLDSGGITNHAERWDLSPATKSYALN